VHGYTLKYAPAMKRVDFQENPYDKRVIGPAMIASYDDVGLDQNVANPSSREVTDDALWSQMCSFSGKEII
jgi:hypothetical protein